MTDDLELLREYVAQHSEEAFAQLVERHLNLVYSVALRRVRDPHQAQEIAQAVFVILARKAHTVKPNAILSGWLFRTTRFTAANFVRTESRRRHREQEVYMQSLATESEPADWSQVAPLLDSAIAGLGETDRHAVLLRFMEGKSFQDVGVALGASEDAAKVRVHRALEKLRKFFTRKGVALSSAALTSVISANAVQAAPAGLALSISAGAVQGAALSASTLALAKGVTTIMTWTTTLKITAGVGVALLVAYQAYETVEQRQQMTALQEQLQAARASASAQQASIERLQQDKQALIEEKRQADLAAVRVISRQKAAANASVAQADAIAKGSIPDAIAKILDDPAQKELLQIRLKQAAKTTYASLAKNLKLSPEDSEKLFDLVAEKEMKKEERVALLMQGKLDVATALQAREDDKAELLRQIAATLGEDAAAKFDEANHIGFSRNLVSNLNNELGANRLNKDQGKNLQQLFQAAPMFTVDKTDLFRSPEGLDQYFQQLADRDQRVMEQAATFLTPEQLAAINVINSNKISAVRQQFSLGQQVINRNLTQTGR